MVSCSLLLVSRSWGRGQDGVYIVSVSLESFVFVFCNQIPFLFFFLPLSLYIWWTVSKGIVELHGGSISWSSEGLGKGSLFTVEIPWMATETSASEVSPLYEYLTIFYFWFRRPWSWRYRASAVTRKSAVVASCPDSSLPFAGSFPKKDMSTSIAAYPGTDNSDRVGT